jgi:hypothetical protein
LGAFVSSVLSMKVSIPSAKLEAGKEQSFSSSGTRVLLGRQADEPWRVGRACR